MPKTSWNKIATAIYNQKCRLYRVIEEVKAFKSHQAHKDPYDALVVSLSIDEDDMDNSYGALGEGKSSSKTSKSNKPVDVDEAIQDVEIDTRECVEDEVCDFGPTYLVINKTKWFKKSPRPATPESLDLDWSKYQNADTGPLQNWFPKLEKTAKAPEDFDDVLGLTFDFSNFIKYHLKKDTLTKANLEGDRITQDFSKAIPLLSAHGRQYIPAEFFFNQDLEYLKTGNLKERKYTASLTKTKATSKTSKTVLSHCLLSNEDTSIVRITVEEYCGYGYLKEIVVKRANQKEYMFKEADFPCLHLNDIEDIQNWRDIPRDTPLDKIEVLRFDTKGVKVRNRIMHTKTKPTVEQTQQGVSDEVLVSIEGVEE
ncbi:hypothetical protein Tco_1104209 [Tanacetum coccineum]